MTTRKKTDSPARSLLREWLRGKSRRRVAEVIGISRFGLERYLSGLARPNQDNAFKLEKLTNGKVKSVDWASEDARDLVSGWDAPNWELAPLESTPDQALDAV